MPLTPHLVALALHQVALDLRPVPLALHLGHLAVPLDLHLGHLAVPLALRLGHLAQGLALHLHLDQERGARPVNFRRVAQPFRRIFPTHLDTRATAVVRATATLQPRHDILRCRATPSIQTIRDTQDTQDARCHSEVTPAGAVTTSAWSADSRTDYWT